MLADNRTPVGSVFSIYQYLYKKIDVFHDISSYAALLVSAFSQPLFSDALLIPPLRTHPARMGLRS
jgi:hypothetical protein